MSEASYLGNLMGNLPSSRGSGPPMTRTEAKAQGLKVYPSQYHCSRSAKHGALRLVSSNKCVQCDELERSIEKDLRAKFMDKLKAEAERKALKKVSVILADAHKQAADIIKAAQKEAMDRAKMLEKAKATREARKAQAAASQAGAPKVEVVTQPEGPQAIEVPPWDEPSTEAQEGPQMATDGDGLTDQGGWCPADDGPPW
ncbi:MAG: hypothetical protein EPO09_21290 [Aquabacterium sp.]|uniref:ATP synthase F0 subunit B n=1 Tax=Aquabacterium sp. TaxID=1872578 RepID=UPI001200FE44|nr:ATP synthase F0 subunit B [Aquabacterium sp.]TAK83328.1 MAG: hypothetical protein EPO09_21290 [Aquabacterium sp.]